MVKNIYGGNKHKSQGRKFTVKVSHKLRTAEEGELYAIVTKMLGSGMFYCHCIDDTVRLGYIRGKFSGRGKRDNIVELGKWVLVGEREWESKEKVDKKCDLLEVYNDLDKEKLMDTVSMNWSILNAQDVKQEKDASSSSSSFEFTSERDEEMYKMMDELNANKIVAIDITKEDDWIDDI